LQRLENFHSETLSGDPAVLRERAARVLKSSGYRTLEQPDGAAGERGYLRETANLVFHFALVGILLALGLGTGFKYQGQRVIVEGQKLHQSTHELRQFQPGSIL